MPYRLSPAMTMGPAINVAGSARAVAQSMILATLAALVLVVLIVWPALRNVRDVALVLAPLLLASTLDGRLHGRV
jgi:multidrug efflux pump subunit AcrB